MNQTEDRPWFSIFIFFAICFSIEIAGRLMADISVYSWYFKLKKENVHPPVWLFGPLWTLLYGMLAVSGWLVFRASPSPSKTRALWIYGCELGLGLLWAVVFFFLQSPLLGMLTMIVLVSATIWMIIAFWMVSRLASLLAIPYFFWTAYALLLNGYIFVFNV